jgi:predicted DNA-binding ribbon-helix-helix protein
VTGCLTLRGYGLDDLPAFVIAASPDLRIRCDGSPAGCARAAVPLSFVRQAGRNGGNLRFKQEMRLSRLIKRSFTLAGHRTSIALEQEFWDALLGLARARGQSLSALIAAVDAARSPGSQLASALRVMALLSAEERARSSG